ncbi:TM2 domain-containing protein [Actinomyces sp. MRS3W]|uniref:TM2 domain-containing protein n=1 Tax=Actinomyces sp. MRS3W TaxID=2800796 RepID=UPI0028FCFCE5|nr:NINE protein [Actinomyces sp. MRS3W]MDU0349527.1 NINE protein [Actinomyces sp. MRS3W]
MSQSPNPADPSQQPADYGQAPINGYGQAQPSAYGQPGYDAPAYGQPAYGQPAYGQPTYAQPGYGAYGQPGYVQPKSKVAAALLAFFLGGLGIHNFYRGQTRRGVLHLCLIAATVVLFIIGGVVLATNADAYGYVADGPSAAAGLLFILGGFIASGNSIWAFIEFILILVSKDGSLQ